ncbi:Zn-dependent exopeptidase [Marasmius fiardii PR-910]|nr:Zn-dependent exopeptidase [Marasmius fiardii PR-910]
MSTQPGAPKEFLDYIEQNAISFIDRLAEAVKIESVSSDPLRRDQVKAMSNWIMNEFTKVGVYCEPRELGTQTVNGHELPLPPAILGRLGTDARKKTVLIYGHFDVQPANLEDGWSSPPFKLTFNPDYTGKLVGRGATDDKGPILGWLNVLQYHHENQKELPVNLRFCFEGMEESGSEGLDPLVVRESKPGGWFEGVDCVCISDNYWLNDRTPVVTYGLRGLVYFKLSVWGPARDLHSGVFGRMVHEPMTDLVKLMATLVNVDATIPIEGVDDLVAQADDAEKALYEKLDYSLSDVQAAIGSKTTVSDDKVQLLMNRMREGSLSLHGIEGAFSGSGAKTVIPAKVIGKFSLRIVPPQTPEKIEELVRKHVDAEYQKLGTRNEYSLEVDSAGNAWIGNTNHWNYNAAFAATVAVYGQEPNMTREGGSIPVTLTFAENIKVDGDQVNVVLLPMGRGDDGAHSTNEKLDRDNFIEGSKLLGTYLYAIGAMTQGR